MRQLIVMFILFFSAAVFAVPTTYTQEKPVVMINSKQSEFIIQLKSNPSTGFSWFLRQYDANLITPIKRTYQASSNKKIVGAPGYEYWTFKVKPNAFVVPQLTTLQFVYERAWEVGDTAAPVVFKVVVAAS